MDFEVKLIKVKDLKKLTGVEVFDLMCNAKHIAGDYWIFEGDEESLLSEVSVVDESTSSGTGGLTEEELVEHCSDIFGFDFSKEKPAWKMLTEIKS